MWQPGGERSRPDVNWPRRVITLRKGGSKEGEREERETRRFGSASTWTPPRKRSRSPRGGPMRCKSPHLCRNAANGGCRDELKEPRSRSMTPEDRGRSPSRQEKLARWMNVDSLERKRLSRAWNMMEREQPPVPVKVMSRNGMRIRETEKQVDSH